MNKKVILKIILPILLLFVMLYYAGHLPAFLSARQPIKVGILHSLTGTMAISETSVRDATLLAIEEINQHGGVLGRPIVPIVVDGKSDWPTFAREAERLITVEQVSVVFGIPKGMRAPRALQTGRLVCPLCIGYFCAGPNVIQYVPVGANGRSPLYLDQEGSYVQKPVDFDRFMKVIADTGFYWAIINKTPPPIAQETS